MCALHEFSCSHEIERGVYLVTIAAPTATHRYSANLKSKSMPGIKVLKEEIVRVG
jgi:hypothetical protein